MDDSSKLVTITKIFGHSNRGRLGRGNIGDPRVIFYLPPTKNYKDGVLSFRLRARDIDDDQYRDSINDQQTNDVREYIQGKKHFVLETICKFEMPESELEVLKEVYTLINNKKGEIKGIKDKYFSPRVARLKKKIII